MKETANLKFSVLAAAILLVTSHERLETVVFLPDRFG